MAGTVFGEPGANGTAPRHPLRAAMEAGDLAVAQATLAPDVVAYSPVTGRPFVGREEVGVLLRALIVSFDELEYTDQFDMGDITVVVFRGRVLGRELRGLEMIHHDDEGKVLRIEIGARPPEAVFALAASAAPRFTRWSRGSVWGALTWLWLRPLPRIAALLDGIGSWLARTRS